MKKFLSVIAVLFISANLFAQYAQFYVSGKVLNATTKAPMQGASVFAQNTTLGTATDADGNFKLLLPNGGYDLVVTFTGFNTETKRISTADASESLVVEMKEREKSLEDVVIRSSNEVADGWEKYGDFFLENFIGKTANSQFTSIKNKDALKFYFYKRSNRLKVLASAPVEIVNDALGYTVKYTLDSFVHHFNTQVSIYTGYPLFEEMVPANEEQKAKWTANRMTAYRGSMLHFMRSLYEKKLKEEGFEIQFIVKVDEKEMPIKLGDFYGGMNYAKDDSTQTVEVMPNQTEVAVMYTKEEPEKTYLAVNPEESSKFQLSVLSFLPKESIVIERNGYFFEQSDITLHSYWTWEKVADMLPYDFNPM